MLKALRENLKYLSWVLWLVIIAFILLAFVGLGDLGPGGAGSNVAATVGSKTVSFREFESAYRRMEDFYRQAYGEQFNADFAKQLGLHRQVLDSLVADRILLLEADRLGLEVTDEELRAEILDLPVFSADGGAFIGEDDYDRILRQNGYTKAGFEATMRQDLLLDKVRKVVAGDLYISESEIEKDYRNRTERAKIRFIRVPYATVAGSVPFDEAAVEAYFAEHRDSFETPERRIAEYLIVDVERLRGSLTLAPEEIKAYYEDNRDEFELPEQVHARHILLQVNAKRSADEARRILESAKQRIAAGEDFATLAAELSEDPGSKARGGDLGFFGRGAMVEAFETAAFSTPVGQLAGPVQSDFGLHLIQVLERNEGGLQPFESVEAGIRQRLLLERSSAQAEKKADSLFEQLSASKLDLSEVAVTDDTLTYQVTPAFAADENVPAIGRATPFSDRAFELAVGELSAPVRVPRGWAILRLEQILEPSIPDLEAVRTEVEAKLGADLVRRTALERLTRDKQLGLEALAKQFEATLEETESFGAGGPGGSLGANRAIARAALGAESGSLVGPIATDGGAVVFEVLERVAVDPAQYALERDATREGLERQRAAQLVSALIAKRRQELDISFDPQLLANFDIKPSEPATS